MSAERLAQLFAIPRQDLGLCHLMTIELHNIGKAYVDDSKQWPTRSHADPAVWAMSAYVTHYEAAIALRGEWSAKLKRWGVEVFHATDFMARHGEFRNKWSDDRDRENVGAQQAPRPSHPRPHPERLPAQGGRPGRARAVRDLGGRERAPGSGDDGGGGAGGRPPSSARAADRLLLPEGPRALARHGLPPDAAPRARHAGQAGRGGPRGRRVVRFPPQGLERFHRRPAPG